MVIIFHPDDLNTPSYDKPTSLVTLGDFHTFNSSGPQLKHLASVIMYNDGHGLIKIFKDRLHGRHGVFNINKHSKGLLREYINPHPDMIEHILNVNG